MHWQAIPNIYDHFVGDTQYNVAQHLLLNNVERFSMSHIRFCCSTFVPQQKSLNIFLFGRQKSCNISQMEPCDWSTTLFTRQQLCSRWKPCGQRMMLDKVKAMLIYHRRLQSHLIDIDMVFWLYKLSLVIVVSCYLEFCSLHDTYAGLPSAGIVACNIDRPISASHFSSTILVLESR